MHKINNSRIIKIIIRLRKLFTEKMPAVTLFLLKLSKKVILIKIKTNLILKVKKNKNLNYNLMILLKVKIFLITLRMLLLQHLEMHQASKMK